VGGGVMEIADNPKLTLLTPPAKSMSTTPVGAALPKGSSGKLRETEIRECKSPAGFQERSPNAVHILAMRNDARTHNLVCLPSRISENRSIGMSLNIEWWHVAEGRESESGHAAIRWALWEYCVPGVRIEGQCGTSSIRAAREDITQSFGYICENSGARLTRGAGLWIGCKYTGTLQGTEDRL